MNDTRPVVESAWMWDMDDMNLALTKLVTGCVNSIAVTKPDNIKAGRIMMERIII